MTTSGAASAVSPISTASSPATGAPVARSLLGAPIAAEIKARVKADVAAFRKRNGYAPTLAVVLVGRDAPSAVYLQQILRTCKSVGIDGRLVEIPGRASAARLRNAIVALNADPLVAGIIVQMPLPKRIPLTTVT
jgi:methylenetetrahydrofolate dehydrogenase (NADP+)/methenyltetrahydrofolate cyclohydrolase